MNKIRSRSALTLLFIAIFSFVACKKDLNSGKNPAGGGNISVTNNTALKAGNGQTVTIKGQNLLASGQNPVVTLNKRQLTITLASNDSLRVVIPRLAGSGKFVITANGQSYDGPAFTYQYNVTVTTIAGSGSVGKNDGAGKSAQFNCPWGITADDNGDLYIADCYNRLIRKISAATGDVSTIAIPVTINGNNFFSPYNIALNKANHDLYVTDFNQHLLKIAGDGTESVIYNGPMTTTGIALSPDGFLYMSNNNRSSMLQLSTGGDSIKRFTPRIITPRNIIFDQNANMFVAGYDASSASAAIYQIGSDGNGTIIAKDKAFQGWEIAVDHFGNFYEADHFSNVIKLIDPSGNIVIIAGNGAAADVDGTGVESSFDGPQGLTIDSQGNLYVTTFNYADNSGNKVRKIVID